jgi:hypothetical protein
MYEISIPLEAVKRLSDEDRFSYYLLGHIFNELMSLQKIVGFSLPKHQDTRAARVKPEQAQAMLLFRLASAKIWEAIQAIRQSKQLATTLRRVVLPRMPDGMTRLKNLNASVNAAAWLSPLRNGMGFHFPTFDHWKAHITPDESWVDDRVYLGEQSGNTFYDAADSIGQSWMFSQYGTPNVREAVDPLIDQMIQLLGEMNGFLEEVLGTFIGQVILDGQVQRRHVGKVLSPQYDRVTIPFWTAMPQRKEN